MIGLYALLRASAFGPSVPLPMIVPTTRRLVGLAQGPLVLVVKFTLVILLQLVIFGSVAKMFGGEGLLGSHDKGKFCETSVRFGKVCLRRVEQPARVVGS